MVSRIHRLIGFFREQSRTTVFKIAVVGFCLALLPGSWAGYKFYKFSWTDPRFCFTCHIHDYALTSWKKSAHGNVTTCHDCHHMPLLHYTYIGVRTVIDRPTYPEDLKGPPLIPNEICMKCHVKGDVSRENWTLPFQFDKLKKVPTIDQTAGHRWHIAASTDKPTEEVLRKNEAKENILKRFHPKNIVNCTRCHGSEHNRPHQYRATDVNCRSCHKKSHINEQYRFVESDCLLCHINSFVLDYRNPAAKPLKKIPEKRKNEGIEKILKDLKSAYPIEER